jgi:hypothetical protein
MEFSVEKFISNFVESQFPVFYQEEGPNFILFMKAYYEWIESADYNGPVRQSRLLLDYRDIDNTLENFLEFFQKKYLYGIPFNVIANKRFLLKHILDVYRSKGTIQCYRLLFKLLYNEDVDIYLPGIDVLRPSDGTWVEPKYLEVTENDNLNSFIGKTIVGVSSGTTAVVEDIVKEAFNNDIINVIYISNVLPKGGDFEVGEKILEPSQTSNTSAVNEAPSILGSLNSLSIINGGQDFNIGDVLKLVYKDPNTGDVQSFGRDGYIKITGLSRGIGTLNFDVQFGGFGYILDDSKIFVYGNDSNGQGASFKLGSISSTRSLTYNTDLICDYTNDTANLTLDAASYGFPSNPTANLSSNIGPCLSFTSDIFGSVFNLTEIRTGNGYTQPANVFVRSVQLSNILPGTISYNSSSNTVTGTSTKFQSYFSNNDVVYLQSNVSLSSTIEYAVIKQVVSNTSIILYGPPTLNSTATAVYKAAPVILPSQFALYESAMVRPDGTINGQNEIVSANPSVGNNVVSKAVSINSGKAYSEGELVKAYLYGAVSNNITILNGGSNYSNDDVLIFAGGSPGTEATGYVSVDGNGTITSTSLTFGGSGYNSIPNIAVKSSNGTGAVLTATLSEYNTSSEVIGRVVKAGIGKSRGYWSTTRSFLNSDKYIQDSYYYQDFSYEIRVAQALDKYKNIIYNTFHSAGSELFGKYLKYLRENQPFAILDEDANVGNLTTYLYASETTFTADNNTLTVDKYYV